MTEACPRESGEQRPEGRMGKPGNQGNTMQASRITGNEDTLEMVGGFAPYPHTRCFHTSIYADLHRVGVFILFLSRILYKLALFFSKQTQFCGGTKFR
jgi:hypothetical protein